jgi:hypothetical protein
MDLQSALYGLFILFVMYVLLFVMYCHYHLDTFSKYFGKSNENDEFYTQHRRLLYRKDTPYKRRNTSESCPGGLDSFQMNIRKLRPLHGTPSMPDLKTEENTDRDEN